MKICFCALVRYSEAHKFYDNAHVTPGVFLVRCYDAGVDFCVSAFPLDLAGSASFVPSRMTSDSVVDIGASGTSREAFLKTFCRYCHSQPFFCGDMLQLCYTSYRFIV